MLGMLRTAMPSSEVLLRSRSVPSHWQAHRQAGTVRDYILNGILDYISSRALHLWADNSDTETNAWPQGARLSGVLLSPQVLEEGRAG